MSIHIYGNFSNRKNEQKLNRNETVKSVFHLNPLQEQQQQQSTAYL